MKSFKEISKNIISLKEGLFDMEGENRIAKEISKDSAEMFLKTCKGSFSPVYFKDGSVRINGKLILKINTDKLYFNCRDFHGKLIIENCPKLETLEGSFLEKMAVFDGSITINQCPSLTSLKGLPGLIKGDLSITNCKKLKSIDGVDTVFGNLYWSGNGKKYTEDDLKNKTHVIKRIFCSEENIDANIVEGVITESFNNPWLQRLAAQLKKYPFKEYSWDDDSKFKYNNVDQLFLNWSRISRLGSGRILDKITSEEVDTYDMGNDKDKKDLAKVFYNAYNADDRTSADIILIYKEDIAEFIGAYGYTTKVRGAQNKGVQWINIPHKGSYNNKMSSGEFLTKTEAKEKLLRYDSGYTIVVFNCTNEETGDDARYELKKSRIDAQSGVINPGDVEQYKAIAAANLKRYKDLLAQMRLNRKKSSDTDGYDKLIDQYEQINTRIIKLVRNISKDPKKYSKYEVTGFLHWVRDEQRYNPNYKSWRKNSGSPYYGEYGLVYIFKNFIDNYMNCFGAGYKDNPDESDFKYLETASKKLEQVLKIADTKLKKFGV